MTWEDWPEGGSFGTIIEAPDHETAESLCRDEAEGMRGDPDVIGEENHPHPYREDWHTVDCWDVDEFIANHQRKPTTNSRQVCETCGGDQVSCDATVRWSVPNQAWEITSVQDGEYCDDCDGEVRIETRAI